MNTSRAIAMVTAFTIASVTAPNAFSATDDEARECGVAASKMYIRYVRAMLKSLPDVCQDRSKLAERAEKIAQKRNKHIELLNKRHSDANCDPDAAGLFPITDFHSPDLENLMETASIGGATLIELCDNVLKPDPA